MKIVIVGAGISGCAAYLALKKNLPKPPAQDQDHSYTIYEAYDVSSISKTNNTTYSEAAERPVVPGETHSSTLAVGGGLGIAPNGLSVLKRLDEDLLRDVVRNGYPYSRARMMNSYGWTLMRADATGSSDPDGPPMNSLGISRHALWKCLRDRVPDEIIIQKRVTRVVANAEGRNVVIFADGSVPVEADLVIGADGLKSTVKRALSPEAERDPYPPQYEGLVGIGGFIPATPDLKTHIEENSMTFVFGGNGFFGYFFSNTSPSSPNRDSPYHVSEPGDTVTWWSTYSIAECPTDPKAIDKEDVSRQLRERHGDWRDPVVQKIVNSIKTVENVYPAWTMPELPTWERDGVVLLGDAAHALPSTSGQGTSQALEDVESFALFLAHYLEQAYNAHDPLTTTIDSQVATEKQAIKLAAKKHMDLRFPRVKQILNRAKKMQGSKRSMCVVEEFLMYLVLWILGAFSQRVSPKEVLDYNVAKEVERMLASERSD